LADILARANGSVESGSLIRQKRDEFDGFFKSVMLAEKQAAKKVQHH
jgi:hypothetical protein